MASKTTKMQIVSIMSHRLYLLRAFISLSWTHLLQTSGHYGCSQSRKFWWTQLIDVIHQYNRIRESCRLHKSPPYPQAWPDLWPLLSLFTCMPRPVRPWGISWRPNVQVQDLIRPETFPLLSFSIPNPCHFF